MGVTEGRVPVASRLYSYSKSATTRRSGRVTGHQSVGWKPGGWNEARTEEKKVKPSVKEP